jgi:hypothetical protein
MNKGTVIQKAKEALSLNDTSVDAKLLLNGTAYAIDTFNIKFQQSFDFKGEPQREVKGGLLTITMNQVIDEQLNHWMFHRDVKHSGSVVFASFSRIANPVITINFINGRCVRYSKNIGGSSIFCTIVISAQKIEINGMEHKNDLKFEG